MAAARKNQYKILLQRVLKWSELWMKDWKISSFSVSGAVFQELSLMQSGI